MLSRSLYLSIFQLWTGNECVTVCVCTRETLLVSSWIFMPRCVHSSGTRDEGPVDMGAHKLRQDIDKFVQITWSIFFAFFFVLCVFFMFRKIKRR